MAINHLGAAKSLFVLPKLQHFPFARSDNCIIWHFIKNGFSYWKCTFPSLFLFLHKLEPLKFPLLLQNFKVGNSLPPSAFDHGFSILTFAISVANFGPV